MACVLADFSLTTAYTILALGCWSGARVGVIISVHTTILRQATSILKVSYTETGASQLIVDGKIKLKSGPQIEKFTEHAIQFDDGSELEVDVVVFATGCACCSL
jgi:NAD(P)H-nitrite reductase large subunit